MLSFATIVGRTHRLMQQNCHDFACAGSPLPGYAFGLVLDGCGSKYRDGGRITQSHNEVGSKLLGRFAATFLAQGLKGIDSRYQEKEAEHMALLDELFSKCLCFLDELLDMMKFASDSERVRFVASNLLCTIVGFLVSPDNATFFWSGDGYLCHSGTIERIESQNTPDYMAYNLLPDHVGLASRKTGFAMESVEALDQTSWLAVATDGWSVDLLEKLASPRSSLALQRWLNQRGRERGRFEDDGAVVVWWNRE